MIRKRVDNNQKKLVEYTASEITAYALKVLNLQGFEVWRNNNLAVKGRKFIGRKGVADIMGFKRATGHLLACEVKKIGDTLKEDQKQFLAGVVASGAIALIARQEGSQIVIENYQPPNPK